MRLVSCSASEDRRHGHYIGKGPHSHLRLSPCPCCTAISVSVGTLGGCPTEGNGRIIPEMLWCTQVSVLALRQRSVGCAELSVHCADCHPQKRHQLVLASQVAQPTLAKRAQC